MILCEITFNFYILLLQTHRYRIFIEKKLNLRGPIKNYSQILYLGIHLQKLLQFLLIKAL